MSYLKYTSFIIIDIFYDTILFQNVKAHYILYGFQFVCNFILEVSISEIFNIEKNISYFYWFS